MFISYQFIAFIVYFVVWTFIAPIYVLRKAGREFIIEYFGLIVKVLALLISNYTPFITPLQSGVSAALLMAFQFVIFMIFSSMQAYGHSEKLRKLNNVNLVDFWMYLTVTLTALLSLCFILLEDDLTTMEAATSSTIARVLFLVMFCINLLYVSYWLYKVARLGLKHLRATSRG